MNNDVEQLFQSATNDSSPATVAEMLASLIQVAENGGTWADPARLALGADVASGDPGVSSPARSSQSAVSGSQGSGVGETVLKTAAMMTGVGPLVTGLMKLFGSDDTEPVAPLEKFVAPSPVSVEAGLTRDRQYSAIRYGQNGTPEALDGTPRRSSEAPAIQVNIQAMDSQSFLDRQDDIARAVREAMLHSNSLNDVVLEL